MSFEDVIQEFIPLKDIKQWIEENRLATLSFLVLVVASLGGWYYFSVYRVRQFELAYEALSDCLQETTQAYQNPSLWDEVEIAAHTGLRQFGKWAFKSYFKTIQAEALLRQGDAEQAYRLLAQAYQEEAPSSPFYGYILIKKLLIGIDLDYEESVTELADVAHDTKSSVQDMALYFLGNYYFLADEIDNAKEAWQTLVEMFDSEEAGSSPWAGQARARLGQL